jgi:hypothetical protein
MINSIDYKADGFKISLSGRITTEEVINVSNTVLQHRRFKKATHQIWHFNEVEDVLVNANDIYTLAIGDNKRSKDHPSMKIALVSDCPLVHGLGKMYEVYTPEGDWEAKLFNCPDLAQEWVHS